MGLGPINEGSTSCEKDVDPHKRETYPHVRGMLTLQIWGPTSCDKDVDITT
jgi:hypothetical protein